MKVTFLIALIFIIGCQTSKPISQVNQSNCDVEMIDLKLPDCTAGMICTSEYKTIAIQVLDKEGAPVQFDEYSIKNVTTGKAIEIEAPEASGGGYVIAEDAMKDELDQTGHCIELNGWINEQLILQYSVLVGHDCCHVILLSGKETITI